MPTLMPSDTAKVLGSNAEKCDSRSLLMDRFADPAAKDSGDQTPRRNWFKRLRDKPAVRIEKTDWASGLRGAVQIYAQLQSRLMVNMAGSVMENAGLCLDRFGLPYIPGSAVKGCARRAAMQELLEAEMPEAKSNLLVNIALVFGWGDTDWKPGRKRKRKDGREIETEPYSDFWWTMAQDSGGHSADDKRDEVWREVSVSVANQLLDRLNVRNRKHPDQPWKDLPNVAGLVSFLPAHQVDASGAELPLPPPPLGKLELDVVTCHHPDYYSQKTGRDGQPLMPIALDVEDPNPVVFPAVALGHVFVFGLAPLRECPNELLTQARAWLAAGLETFGLGAKTNAGYGWFEVAKTNEAVSRQQKTKADEWNCGPIRNCSQSSRT